MSSPSQTASPTASSSSTATKDTPAVSIDSLLSYPSPTAPETRAASSTQQSRPLVRERLYVGNLHPTVDEYTLLQVFNKYGKVSKLDFLFHKTGPMKGKPRGYAFVEYSSVEDAQNALESANNKLLRGRKLFITYAHQAPQDQTGAGSRYKRMQSEASKPTTLSLLKSASTGRQEATGTKIAKMEAKLRQMEQSSSGSSSRLHPSLPSKPTMASIVASTMDVPPAGARQSLPSMSARKRIHQTLPSLPMPNPTKSTPSTPLFPSAATPPRVEPAKKAATPLTGVRIVKKKDR
ncbi:RNA-binding domain-containing protein [Laetiporus sulphureus 93-53]|uniref:Probable RNA-binding protein 18 n=1 Tax=Laetiporus sulphureus 93-53 TaxID=1314785 RepID=A0A165CXA9_9APHY|nr:RNA-binding domain-containing protein [Laetiporus sulphureus 93-53]KZT03649.1 RNA-binding domain-containing protein [Laetiporus sulphureus 93-53]